MASITFTGIVELQKKLKKSAAMSDVKRVVQQNGVELLEKVARNAEFDKGYQTGTTQRSVDIEFRDGGMTVEVEPHTEYAAYLEFGTRFMEAQPFVEIALNAQLPVFKRDLEKLVR